MEWIPEKFIKNTINYKELIHAIKLAYRKKTVQCPPKLAYQYKSKGNDKENTVLLMPAWDSEKYLGIKIITTIPSNYKLNIPYINGTYVLIDAKNGLPLINMDAKLITYIRTAATSVLVSRYLAKKNASQVLILGNGNLSPFFIEAYRSVSTINTLYLWGRNFDQSKKIVSSLYSDTPSKLVALKDFSTVVKNVDIISTITSTHKPLIDKEHLSKGQHFDLVGSFTKAMCEASSDVIASCSVYVDNFDSTVKSAGEIVNAIIEKKIEKKTLKETSAICVRTTNQRGFPIQKIPYLNPQAWLSKIW